MLYTLRYRHAGLMLRGVADSLRGAEILDTTDAEPFADLIAVQLDPAAPISADRRRRALAADAPPRSLKRRMIARLSLGGRLLPPLWPRREVREALTAGDPLALLGCSLLQAGDRAWLDCDARPCPLLSPPGGRSDLADSARPGVPSAAQIVPEKARGSVRRGALVRPAWARAAIAITSPRILRPARTALRLSQSLASLAFVQRRPIGRDLHVGDVPANTLNWVVPPPGLGSGGHKIIFRFVPHFEALGFDCRIVVGDTEHLSLDHALQSIRDCFLPIPGPVYLGMERALPAQVTIAANWATDYLVRDFLSTRCRRYFVQDFELWFYPTGSEQALAEAAHRLSFHGITAGTWLRDKLTSEYRMTATAVGCSYDRERCAPGTRRPPSNRTVLFYASPPARPPTQRRGFEPGMLVLAEVKRRVPDAHILVIRWDVSGFGIPFALDNPGVVSLEALPDCYRQSDVVLVLSISNGSLMPLELMACGTPPDASSRAPWTERLLDDANTRLAELTVEALANAVVAVLESPAEQARLREAGLLTAARTDCADDAGRMAEVLRALPASGPTQA